MRRQFEVRSQLEISSRGGGLLLGVLVGGRGGRVAGNRWISILSLSCAPSPPPGEVTGGDRRHVADEPAVRDGGGEVRGGGGGGGQGNGGQGEEGQPSLKVCH